MGSEELLPSHQATVRLSLLRLNTFCAVFSPVSSAVKPLLQWLQSDMSNYPTDPDTGVCLRTPGLSGGLACLSRQKVSGEETDSRTIESFQETGGRELQERDEGNIGSIITMLITDQVSVSRNKKNVFTCSLIKPCLSLSFESTSLLFTSLDIGPLNHYLVHLS